jgi:hypothetical protein
MGERKNINEVEQRDQIDKYNMNNIEYIFPNKHVMLPIEIGITCYNVE